MAHKTRARVNTRKARRPSRTVRRGAPTPQALDDMTPAECKAEARRAQTLVQLARTLAYLAQRVVGHRDGAKFQFFAFVDAIPEPRWDALRSFYRWGSGADGRGEPPTDVERVMRWFNGPARQACKLRDLLDKAMREPSIVATGMRCALDEATKRGIDVERTFGALCAWKNPDAPSFVTYADLRERYSGSLDEAFRDAAVAEGNAA